MKDEREIDDIIMSLATVRWRKTAMVIAKALDLLGCDTSDESANKVAERIERLVEMDRLESRGDLSRWRFSEIRRQGLAG